MSNAIVINAENVLNLDNATLANFLKEQGVKGFARVSKTNRDAAEAAAKAFFSKVTSAEGATDGRNTALETAQAGAFQFATAASVGATGGAVAVRPEGWTSVEGGGSEAEAASAEHAEAATDGETDEEAAARIEAEAAAEAGETEEQKTERTARAAARASNSVGVALSWRNPEVRAARLTRDGVHVTDANGADAGTYKSVAEAFRALRLPFEKHIKFRLALKTSRKETINGFTFEM